jgi:hypothetical protein
MTAILGQLSLLIRFSLARSLEGRPAKFRLEVQLA